MIYRVLLSFVPLFLLPVHAAAFSVQVQPESLHPGDVFVLQTEGGETVSADVSFLSVPVPFRSLDDGTLVAIVPIDINTVPGDYPVHISRSDERVTLNLKVLPREARTIYLTVSEAKVTLSPEDQKRVDRESRLQQDLWGRLTPPAWNGSFTKPTATETSTEFGVKRIFNKKRTSIHRGMDFRGKTGAPVKAINSGTVVLAQELFYGGNTLVIDHGIGLYSVYMHMSEFKVRTGELVRKGQLVGLVGSSGRVTGPHLHLSVKLDGVSVDPESLFRLKL